MPEIYVTFYATYGYKVRDYWKIPMRIWVRETSDAIRRLAAKGARRIIRKRAGLERLDETQKQIFMSRAEDFVSDSRSRQTVAFVFDKDPDNEIFQLKDKHGNSRTDRNGLVLGEITLSDDKTKRLLAAQAYGQGWFTCRTVSKNHYGVGKVRLIEPGGRLGNFRHR